MIRIVLGAIWCFLFSYAAAQNTAIDSLAALLKSSPSNTQWQSQLELQSGLFYYENTRYDSALYFLEKANNTAAKIKDAKAQTKALNAMGNIYSDKGDNVKALPFYHQALALADAENDKITAARITKNIGILYVQWKNFPQALKYYRQAIETAKAANDYSLAADCYNNIGIVYEQESKFAEALEVYNKALEYYTQANKQTGIAMTLSNQAIVHKYMGNYDLSVQKNLQSLAISQQTGDQWSQGATLNNLASVLIKKKDLQTASQYALQAEQVARQLGAKEILVATYETLAEVAHQQGKHQQSFQYLKTMMAVKDSFINLESTKQMAELQTKFETAKTEKLLLQTQWQNTRKNYLLAGLSMLLVMGSLLSFSSYKRYKLKKEKELQTELIKQQDLATKAVMEAEENERRRIATELHDGVGQMMSAARMNLSTWEKDIRLQDDTQQSRFEKIVSLVDESCKEVRAVSHSMMPNALLKRGLAAAVRDFIDKIDTQIIKVQLHAEGLNERLDNTTESMLYRIIQECVNNVVKHSRASHLDISLIKEPDGISLSIEDNGVGFDSKATDMLEGIGLKNIASRVQFLKGTIDIDSAPGKGTLIAIHVPLINV